jgi:regulator of replication initiation timing
MAIEADETGINGIRMPVEHESGDVSNIRFVLESELMAESERLREENANLKSLLREALEKKFSNEDKLQSENAKLRWLVGQWYPHALRRVGRDALEQWGQMDIVRDLGIEVKE